MRIMKVVYSQEQYEPTVSGYVRSYMGEASWAIGETFNSEYLHGTVEKLVYADEGDVQIWILPSDTKNLVLAMILTPHVVHRIYYGE